MVDGAFLLPEDAQREEGAAEAEVGKEKAEQCDAQEQKKKYVAALCHGEFTN